MKQQPIFFQKKNKTNDERTNPAQLMKERQQ
jgi:hypothetical protein